MKVSARAQDDFLFNTIFASRANPIESVVISMVETINCLRGSMGGGVLLKNLLGYNCVAVDATFDFLNGIDMRFCSQVGIGCFLGCFCCFVPTCARIAIFAKSKTYCTQREDDDTDESENLLGHGSYLLKNLLDFLVSGCLSVEIKVATLLTHNNTQGKPCQSYR